MRGMAYKRFQREKHIKRKEDILRAYRLDNPPHKYNDKDLFSCITFPRGREVAYEGSWLPYWIVRARGQLNKGKIHCGCGMCMAKTRNKGKKRHVHGNYAPAINYKISDLRRAQQMDWDESHWNIEDEFPRGLRRETAIFDDEVGYWISDEELNELIASLSD